MATNAKKTKKAARSKATKASSSKGASVRAKSGSARAKSESARAKSESPGQYALEALTEWGKAARFGAAALLSSGAGGAKAKAKADKPPLKERLNPATTEKGGKAGDAADNVLSKFGFLGKAASKLSLGSRAVDKVLPDAVTKTQPSGGGGGAARNGSHDHPPVPIQESIELAIPIRSAFALATRFDDFPQWSDRIANAEEVDETHVSVDMKVRGAQRSIELEITDLHEPLRIEWEVTEGMDAGGMLTFHELAPSLTHVELSLDADPTTPVQRFTRSIHLPDRVIRAELHRFKAWAELWQEVEDIEPPEEPEDEFEEAPEEQEEDLEEEPEDEFDEEPVDEEDLDEEPVDEEDLDEEPEDEFDDEPEDEDEFVDEEDEDFDEEGLEDEEGEPAGTR